MCSLEINGNLYEIDGINEFETSIVKVFQLFIEHFGLDIMNQIDLYIDNAINDSMSGYTPIITPVFKKFLIIKLGIENFKLFDKIVYQFSHELCHYLFYCIYGLNKQPADLQEESICSAMSLCVIKNLYPQVTDFYKELVKNLDNKGYQHGYIIANKLNYDIKELKEIIFNKNKCTNLFAECPV